MAEGVGTVGIYVRDQDEAIAFYVGKLGFQVHTDARNGNYRWLTVQHSGQIGFQLGLFRPGPPTVDEATARTLGEVVAKARCRRWCLWSTTAARRTPSSLPRA